MRLRRWTWTPEAPEPPGPARWWQVGEDTGDVLTAESLDDAVEYWIDGLPSDDAQLADPWATLVVTGYEACGECASCTGLEDDGVACEDVVPVATVEVLVRAWVTARCPHWLDEVTL
jgi:hypothetical protein